MKMFEKKLKPGVLTVLFFILVLFEFGMLTDSRYITATAENPLGIMTIIPVGGAITDAVGWNYIGSSIIAIIAIFGYAMMAGYGRNIGCLVALLIFPVLSVIGAFVNYDFLFSWTTAHLSPAMIAIFKIYGEGTIGAQLAFIIVVAVITVVCWVVGKIIRKKHADKYEF